MKNNLFGKAIPLVMGSLVLFSSQVFSIQALAISSNKNQELTNAEALGESEILIAQRRNRGGNRSQRRKKPLRTNQTFAQSISRAQTVVGNALAIANSEAISGSGKTALANSIAQASTLIGNAAALSSSTAQSDVVATAQSLAEAVTFIGNALAIAESEAVSGDGGSAVATSLASAQSVLGSATAIASSSARSD